MPVTVRYRLHRHVRLLSQLCHSGRLRRPPSASGRRHPDPPPPAQPARPGDCPGDGAPRHAPAL